MSIFHYFSADENIRSKFIFNTIASIYSKVKLANSSYFRNAISHVHQKINIENKTVLDIGTGTGEWAAMYEKQGAKFVHGIDFAANMLKKAKQKHKGIEFTSANAEELKEFADNTFDIVTASLVIHGVKQDKREKILSEMNRITKSHIVLHDFIGKTPAFVKLLEFIEQSDYKHFKKNILNELNKQFKEISATQIKTGTGIYIAKKKHCLKL